MSRSRPATYLNCPSCAYTARSPGLAWVGTDCPRCRARGKRIELIVIDTLRSAAAPPRYQPGS